jgi:hypothetical protein
VNFDDVSNLLVKGCITGSNICSSTSICSSFTMEAAVILPSFCCYFHPLHMFPCQFPGSYCPVLLAYNDSFVRL